MGSGGSGGHNQPSPPGLQPQPQPVLQQIPFPMQFDGSIGPGVSGPALGSGSVSTSGGGTDNKWYAIVFSTESAPSSQPAVGWVNLHYKVSRRCLRSPY
jgi:hypothetical protein